MSSTYCTSTLMSDDFGTSSITAYSNPDGDATAAARRITEAIAIAGDEIDGALLASKYSYRLPIQDEGGATPRLIQHIAAALATVWLYDMKGARDKDDNGKPFHLLEFRRDWARQTLEKIRRGELRLTAVG